MNTFPKFELGQKLLDIVSCAGPAEAGWEATIAAIDGLLSMPPLDLRGRAIDNILTAWPIELLD